MKNIQRYIAIVFLFLGLLFSTQAAFCGNYYFKQIASKEGLPSTIRCVVSDHKGFIWIGTKFGVACFDGHKLRKYRHQFGNEYSLPSNLIHRIVEDHQHNIWILTDNGVVRYNQQSDNFEPLLDESHNRVIAYSACFYNNNLVLGSQNKVYLLNNNKKYAKLILNFSVDANFIITNLSIFKRDILICSSRWTGIVTFNLKTRKRVPSPFNCGKEIISMITDSHGRIWIAPYNHGILCYNNNGKQISSFQTSNSAINSNVVLCLAERNGQIWIGTDGGGINILNPQNRQFSQLIHIPGGGNYSLPSNSILSLYNDHNNNIWAGSIRNGLISIREVSMKTYTEVLPGNKKGLSNNCVLSLFQDKPDKIWIGTDGGGVNSMNLATEEFRHYLTTYDSKIASICSFAPGKLLVFIFTKGVYVFDEQTGRLTPFIISDVKTNAVLCNSGLTVNIFNNTPQTIMFLGKNIFIYHKQNKSFTKVVLAKGLTLNGSLLPICTAGRYTYLNDDKHIFRFDNMSNRLQSILRFPEEVNITSTSRDEFGNFWIGTSSGLLHFDSRSLKTTAVPINLFDNINQLLCDQHGKVWIGTDNMLLCWFIKEKRYVLFGESDGVMSNEYLPKPKLIISQGDVFLGGVQGLLGISHKLVFYANNRPQLLLSEILVNGESSNNLIKGNTPSVTVSWNSNLTLRIMSKEADIFRQKIYRYIIKGLNEQHIKTYDPELVIRSLPPGSYTILASCTMSDGKWIPDQVILKLTVRPPWYRSWWFISLCVILLGVVIVQGIRFTIRRKEEKLRWQMKEHEQQTYKEKVQFLINISHELRTPLTLIHAPISRILKSLQPSDTNYLQLKSIFRQSQRMKDLINMVLDVRKMEVGESKLLLQPYQMNDRIADLTQDFLEEGKARNVSIDFDFDPKIGIVSYDKEKCDIIFNNLLINALKHSPQDTTITISTKLMSDGQTVRIAISDRGEGLKNVDGDRLFTRFYQGEGERNGTGIGLSYSKILVEQQGGHIGAFNREGGGSTFYIDLPLRNEQVEIICPPKPYINELIGGDQIEDSNEDDSFDTSADTILFVDDNEELTRFINESLKSQFKHIFVAANGVEALRIVHDQKPDIVVSDVMMPKMNGYELCKEIKKDITISHIPIILLTARDDRQSQINGYKNEADGYLTKPFEIEVLVALIKNRLKERSQTRHRYIETGVLPAVEESTFSAADESFLIKFNQILNEHIGETATDINFLCQEIGMSRASLYNKIKAITNMSTGEYINKFRMEKAIALIQSTNLSFVEIAEQAGFTTARYFSTAFKQYTGKTPSQYREALKEKE